MAPYVLDASVLVHMSTVDNVHAFAIKFIIEHQTQCACSQLNTSTQYKVATLDAAWY